MKNTNFDSAKEFVKMKRRQNYESLSGMGSYLKNAEDSINFINNAIKDFNIKSILDLGCGDWNWFKKIDLEGCRYIGWDADKKMILDNQDRFGSTNVTFENKDIFSSEYPETDIIICRDVLFHVREELSLDLINKCKKSSKYFISTSFRNEQKNTGIKKYCDIKDWGFYKINLNIEPFFLIDNEVRHCVEKHTGYDARSICLYKMF